jgi:predicted transcriptional regulator
MQRLEPKLRRGRLLILDCQGCILHYRGEGRGDRLGPLARNIITILLHESLTGAEIARRLGVWHNHVHVSLRKLARKSLVRSQVAFGRNLSGTQILRKFYSLNSAKVSIAVPIRSPTKVQLQQAKEKAQAQGLERERRGIALQDQLSPKPLTRLKALLDRKDDGHRPGS